MRIVSLVPSLTETIHAWGLGGSLVGVTKFCIRPADARMTANVVGGTKDPNVETVRLLKPDLVLADEDENKPEHLDALRSHGIKVHTTRIELVEDVARELRAIGALVGRAHEAEKMAADLSETAHQTRGVSRLLPAVRCFVPVWKRPLMSLGARTYMSDLLRTAGGENVFDDVVKKKYFTLQPEEVLARQPDAILLPTEPYRFREQDRKEFAERFELPVDQVCIVDGQAFTWFGAESEHGVRVLADALAQLRSRQTKTT
jgi:ABC-type Fe3+-hydroxamate transport system substrate-binding protein